MTTTYVLPMVPRTLRLVLLGLDAVEKQRKK